MIALEAGRQGVKGLEVGGGQAGDVLVAQRQRLRGGELVAAQAADDAPDRLQAAEGLALLPRQPAGAGALQLGVAQLPGPFPLGLFGPREVGQGAALGGAGRSIFTATRRCRLSCRAR